MSASHEARTVNVISQNVLLDYKRTWAGLILPQDDRVDSLAATFANFSGSLDVVGIQEAHKSKNQHNGEVLASMCGYWPGFWIEHNRKQKQPNSGKRKKGRPDEYMGMFGRLVDYTEPIELGDNRLAVMTVIDDVAFITAHLRAGWDARGLRDEQALRLVDAIEEYDNAVVFGDLNEPPIRGVALARKELARAGFRSVFPLTNQRHPITFPIPPYIEAATYNRSRMEARFVRRGWSIDDILVRGDRIRVLGAGVLERVVVTTEETDKKYPDTVPREGSDHDAPWATLEIAAA